jgi:hypothetical protein
MQKFKYIFLVFCSFFLTGCGGPEMDEIALIGLGGSLSVYIVSFFVTVIFIYFATKRKRGLGYVLRKLHAFFYPVLVLILGAVVFSVIAPLHYGYNPLNPLIAVVLVGILCSLPVLIYTFIALLFIPKGKNFEKYAINVPTFILLLFILSFLLIYIFYYYWSIDLRTLFDFWTWTLRIILSS